MIGLIVINTLFSWWLFPILWCYVIKQEVPLLVGIREWIKDTMSDLKFWR